MSLLEGMETAHELRERIKVMEEELKWRRGVHGITGEAEKLTAQLQSARAENAAMRSALKSAYGFVDAHDNVGHTRVKIQEALSPSAGTNLLERLRKLEAVAEAAANVGMNWKIGAPYGGDALDEALAQLRELGDEKNG